MKKRERIIDILFATMILFHAGCDSSDPLAGVPAGLEIVVEPGSTSPSGAALSPQPSIRLLDHKDKLVKEAGVRITATIHSGPAEPAWVSHATAQSDSLGQATFQTLAITGNEGSYRLSLGGEGLSPSISTPIQLLPPLAGASEDSEGDMTRDGADLVAGLLQVIGGDSLLLSIRWKPGGFIPDTSRASVSLDTDQDALSGHPGINTTGTVDGEFIGSEFLIKVGPGEGPNDIALYEYTGWSSAGVGRFNKTSLSCCVAFLDDGFDARVPLGLLGEEETGELNFKVVSTVKVSETGFSGVLDVMPDVGQPAAVVSGG